MLLKPLHKSWLFRGWLLFSVTSTLTLANWIFPFEFMGAAVAENANETYKTAVMYGGFCITVLTIIALVHRSIETNIQIQLSMKQFDWAAKQHSVQQKIKLIEQANLAIATIMRLQDRIFHFNSQIQQSINTFEFNPKVYKQIHSAMLINIKECYRIYEDLLSNVPELLSQIDQSTQQELDATMYGVFQAVSIWPEDPIDVATSQLKNGTVDMEPLKKFEDSARLVSQIHHEELSKLIMLT